MRCCLRYNCYWQESNRYSILFKLDVNFLHNMQLLFVLFFCIVFFLREHLKKQINSKYILYQFGSDPRWKQCLFCVCITSISAIPVFTLIYASAINWTQRTEIWKSVALMWHHQQSVGGMTFSHISQQGNPYEYQIYLTTLYNHAYMQAG